MIIKEKGKKAIELILCAISLPNVEVRIEYNNQIWVRENYSELKKMLEEDLKNLLK